MRIWHHHAAFESAADAVAFAIASGFRMHTKSTFVCMHVHRAKCTMRLRITGSDLYYSVLANASAQDLATHGHQFTELRRLTPDQKLFLEPLAAYLSPKQMRMELIKKFGAIPSVVSLTLKQLQNYKSNRVQHFRANFDYTLAEIAKWVQAHPDYCFTSPADLTSIKDFHLVLCSASLLRHRATGTRTSLFDITFKTNLSGFYLIIEGTISLQQTFRLCSITIAAEKSAQTYQKTLNATVRRFVSEGQWPAYFVSDNEAGIHSAYGAVFPDARRVPCMFHLVEGLRNAKHAYTKKLDKDARAKSSAELSALLSIGDPARSKKAKTLFESSWPDLAADLRDLYGDLGGRSELVPGVPITNNALESFNQQIKQTVTKFRRLPLIELLDGLQTLIVSLEADYAANPECLDATTITPTTPDHVKRRLRQTFAEALRLVAQDQEVVIVAGPAADEESLAQQLAGVEGEIRTLTAELAASFSSAVLGKLGDLDVVAKRLRGAIEDARAHVDRGACCLSAAPRHVAVALPNPLYDPQYSPIFRLAHPESHTVQGASRAYACNCNTYYQYVTCMHSMARRLVSGAIPTAGYEKVTVTSLDTKPKMNAKRSHKRVGTALQRD